MGLLLIHVFTDRDRSDVCSLRLDRHGEFHFELPFKSNHILLNEIIFSSEGLAEVPV